MIDSERPELSSAFEPAIRARYHALLLGSILLDLDAPPANRKMSAPLSLCVINCEDNDHGACVPELYQAAFGTGDPSKERWTVVETAKTGELPAGSFDAIFLTGSHLNVEDALPWMEKLCEYLRQNLQREDSEGGRAGGWG